MVIGKITPAMREQIDAGLEAPVVASLILDSYNAALEFGSGECLDSHLMPNNGYFDWSLWFQSANATGRLDQGRVSDRVGFVARADFENVGSNVGLLKQGNAVRLDLYHRRFLRSDLGQYPFLIVGPAVTERFALLSRPPPTERQEEYGMSPH